LPVFGSSGIWPERNSRLPARMACEYGPMAAGASGEVTALRIYGNPANRMPSAFVIRNSPFTASSRLDDLARAQAAGADADASDAAVDHRADALQVRFEPARGHVVRVADVAADDRPLVTDFAALRHVAYSTPSGNRHYSTP